MLKPDYRYSSCGQVIQGRGQALAATGMRVLDLCLSPCLAEVRVAVATVLRVHKREKRERLRVSKQLRILKSKELKQEPLKQVECK